MVLAEMRTGSTSMALGLKTSTVPSRTSTRTGAASKRLTLKLVPTTRTLVSPAATTKGLARFFATSNSASPRTSSTERSRSEKFTAISEAVLSVTTEPSLSATTLVSPLPVEKRPRRRNTPQAPATPKNRVAAIAPPACNRLRREEIWRGRAGTKAAGSKSEPRARARSLHRASARMRPNAPIARASSFNQSWKDCSSSGGKRPAIDPGGPISRLAIDIMRGLC